MQQRESFPVCSVFCYTYVYLDLDTYDNHNIGESALSPLGGSGGRRVRWYRVSPSSREGARCLVLASRSLSLSHTRSASYTFILQADEFRRQSDRQSALRRRRCRGRGVKRERESERACCVWCAVAKEEEEVRPVRSRARASPDRTPPHFSSPTHPLVDVERKPASALAVSLAVIMATLTTTTSSTTTTTTTNANSKITSTTTTTATTNNASINNAALLASENQYFYEDVVYRVDKRGNVEFGIVMENDDQDLSDESSGNEDSPKRKKGEIRVVWHPSGVEELVNSKKARYLLDPSLIIHARNVSWFYPVYRALF